MKIRTKITLIQLSTIICIFISIFVLYGTYIQSLKLKDVQVKFNQAVDLEYRLNDLLLLSLYSETHIAEQGEEVINTYNSLVTIVNRLNSLITKDFDEISESYDVFYRSWQLENVNFYKPVQSYFSQMISEYNGWLPIIANNGLVKSHDIVLDEIQAGRMKQISANFLQTCITSIEDYQDNFLSLNELIGKVQEDLIYEMDKNLATSALFLICLTLFIVITAMAISMRVSNSLISKIHIVETSLEKIAEGDLTAEDDDKSGDEFSTLTKNFNLLSLMLLGKTSSMREIMNEIGEIISESINIDALLIKITELSKKSSGADSATILLVDKFSDILRVEHVEGFFPPPYSIAGSVKSKRELIEEKFKSTPIAFGSSYLSRDSILKGTPHFVKDTQIDTDQLPLNSNPRDILFVKSSMTIPLVVSNKLLGVISLAKTKGDSTFSDLDFSNMISFVEYVSLTIDNLYKYMELLEKSEMKREINIASEIQTQLLPKKIPVLPNIDVSAFSESARGISGDYYDIYKVSKERSVATVCDVAGKGIAAALVLVIIRTILQLASNSRTSAKDLLTFLNKSLSDRVKTDYFATLSVLVYDDKTNEITISIAGDTPILIYRNKKQIVERVFHNDLPVGIDKKTTYKNMSLNLEEDDILYMFSDGLLEVRNDFNDIFSIDELESFILENSNNRTETITVLLKEYLDEFRGSQPRMDDETVIIFKKI